MPSPFDLADLPFLREALVEVILLGAAGGLLSAWIVLRRLAFFTHAVGSATFPGLVAADASGISPLLAGIAVALGYAGGVERAGRAGREPSEATALLLVAALAVGVVLASDVFESGAAVDRLLFGTLLGLGTADLALHPPRPPRSWPSSTVTLGRTWSAIAFDPDGAPALGLPAARADFAPARRWWRWRRSRRSPPWAPSWWPRSTSCPAPRRGWSRARSRRCWPGRLRSRSPRASSGSTRAYWLDLPPGPPVAVLGALVYAVLALGTTVRLGAAPA